MAPPSLQIGPLRLRTNLLLAPIAGYCDLAFRTICREWGGVGLACTDLLSPQGLLRGTATSLDLAKTNAADKPVGMQLYGSDPEIMAQGARWAVEHGATLVDINMGCPVDKVTKKDGGSKLLTDLPRAARIVDRVRRELDACALSPDEWSQRVGPNGHPASGIRHSSNAPRGEHLSRIHKGTLSPDSVSTNPESRIPIAAFTPSGPVSVPLTCKLRLCWHTADYDAGRACSPDLARALADAGVAAVTVHGRTTEDKFAGTVRPEGIARVVDAVNGRIPVIGNGDVREPHDALRMLRVTGCNGVMIGRGALSTPWLFRDAWALLSTGVVPEPPTLAEKIATIRRYFDLMLDHRDERYAMFQIRRRISWFAKRLQRPLENGTLESVKPLKEAIRTADSPAMVLDALDRFLAGGLRGGIEAEPEEAEASRPRAMGML